MTTDLLPIPERAYKSLMRSLDTALDLIAKTHPPHNYATYMSWIRQTGGKTNALCRLYTDCSRCPLSPTCNPVWLSIANAALSEDPLDLVTTFETQLPRLHTALAALSPLKARDEALHTDRFSSSSPSRKDPDQ